MNAIETQGLTKRFGKVGAVRDVSLHVAQGGIYALMGPNGSGKSTLIKMLMNLVRPTSGKSSILGEDSEFLRGEKLARIGYVSENQKMPDWMTVAQFLSYWRPFYPTWDRDLEEKLVRRLELPTKKKLKRMSRGARMKASLVSVLAYRPRAIVLDEPLSGLDPLVRDELMGAMLELTSEATVLFSSHDLAEIEHFADHVGYMEDGQLLLSESIADVRGRFRRVTARKSTPILALDNAPNSWHRLRIDGNQAEWVEADFQQETSLRRAHDVLGEVETLSEPLGLREVFLTMASIRRSATVREAEL